MKDNFDIYKLLDKLSVAIFVLRIINHETKDFEIIYANDENKAVCGVDMKKFVGTTLRESFPDVYGIGLPDEYFKSIKKQIVVELGEVEFNSNDFEKAKYVIKATPLNNDEVMVTYSDVSSLRKVEQELRNKNDILEKKNKSLEEFAYITSHDLQEPLNTISSFVDLFLTSYKENFDESGQKMLTYIDLSTKRVKKMILSILEYSRLGNSKEKEKVDCQSIIEDIKADFQKVIEEKSVVFEVKHLPIIKGTSSEIRMIFQNLISNAIKYQPKYNIPEIEIGAKDNNDKWLFYVKDNGIGIDREHQCKIFKIFQRLHLQEEYKGTGIGLSNCEKIVNAHKGKIWVESEKGLGSTFYFTILKE